MFHQKFFEIISELLYSEYSNEILFVDIFTLVAFPLELLNDRRGLIIIIQMNLVDLRISFKVILIELFPFNYFLHFIQVFFSIEELAEQKLESSLNHKFEILFIPFLLWVQRRIVFFELNFLAQKFY